MYRLHAQTLHGPDEICLKLEYKPTILAGQGQATIKIQAKQYIDNSDVNK